MKRAVFIDRDGTLNVEVGNLRRLSQLRLLPKAAEAVRMLRKKNFLAIIISNQPVVARGWITENDLNRIHTVIGERLARKKVMLDAIYYCPHHPNGKIKKYRKNCLCRKPGTGLIKKAAKKFNISLKNSYFVGDSTRDILAAKKLRIRSILVKTGYAGNDNTFDVKPDFIAKNLYDAVNKYIF